MRNFRRLTVELLASVMCLFLIVVSGGCSFAGRHSSAAGNQIDLEDPIDALAMLYSIADQKGMRVITDLNMGGGELYHTYTVDKVIKEQKEFIQQYHKRYGSHKSFWGWYINNELNPLKVTEVEVSTFWRTMWKAAVEECHAVAPGSKVTISPFFILDKKRRRGFEYLEPLEYEKWWAKTLKETGIDILMIQDSGAEHLSLFTIADREPFLAAFQKACKAAGAKLWINVETGQVDVTDWDDAIKQEKSNKQKWVFPNITFLEQKLKLAAKYGEEIISWGHYPYMNTKVRSGLYVVEDIPQSTREANYNAYKNYYTSFPAKYKLAAGEKTKPLINGSLWWMPANYENLTKSQIQEILEEQVEEQKQLGYDLIWIVNAPNHMAWAIKK